MKNSAECLREVIDSIGETWKREMAAYLRDELEEAESQSEVFEEFFDAYKEDIIGNKVSNLKEVEAMIENDLLIDQLKNYIEDMLSMYLTAEPLRVMEVKEYDMLIKVIDDIFDEAIIRFNPEFADAYEEYGFISRDMFIDNISVMETLSSFAVKKNFSLNAIEKLTYRNIRLSKKTCHHIANRINKAFDQIRFKLIIEKLYSDN